ncbi:LysR family transcriptional regulator [Salinicola acroporae]|uniref:LysR family transcriptional regulator n=1 Tax=Salinicola acroporae TaxID=1541440 RepID=UPI0019810208|nr:LysR family transcriptional regulator [Salinicola acroporae]
MPEFTVSSLERVSWDDVRIFLHVARAGNLSRAAKSLHIDQSTVSRHIAQLEYELGLSLFDRARSGLTLSEFGKRFLKSTEAMETGFFKLKDELFAPGAEQRQSVRLGTMEGIASLYLTDVLPEFQRLHPEILLELVTSSQRIHVNQREADIFIGFFESLGRGMDAERIGRFALYLYAAPVYAERHGLPRNLGQLSGHSYIGYVEDQIQIDAVRWLQDLVPDPHLICVSSSMLAQMFLATKGIGLVMLPSFANAERFGLFRVMPETAYVMRDVWMNVHRELRYSARVKSLVEFLQCRFHEDTQFGL